MFGRLTVAPSLFLNSTVVLILKLLEQSSIVCVWAPVPDYELSCYHLPRYLAPDQALYILLALVQIQYVAQANTSLLYHPPYDSLNHCTLEGLVHVRLRAAHHNIIL